MIMKIGLWSLAGQVACFQFEPAQTVIFGLARQAAEEVRLGRSLFRIVPSQRTGTKNSEEMHHF
ncbi:MAG: hypothetical protein J0I64_00695 [Devosia sp.]|nr:hypothetical protein [Devosia sp.]